MNMNQYLMIEKQKDLEKQNKFNVKSPKFVD